MKRRIVFHINELLNGGIEKVLIALLKAIDKERYEVTLLLTYNMGKHQVFLAAVPAEVRIQYLLEKDILNYGRIQKKTGKITIPERLWEELVLPVFKKRVIARKLKDIAAETDVFIDYDMTLAGYIPILAQTFTVAYCHFSLVHYWHGLGAKRKMKKLVSRLAKYNKVVMLCNEMKDDAEKLFPVLGGNTISIYNALDIQHIAKRASEPFDAAVFPEGYIVSAGRLDETQKDFTTLINAYEICRKQYSINQKLVLVGDGGSRPDLEKLVAAKGLEQQVYFIGFQSNPYTWIQHADIFVLSSKYEGLPTVLIEALILNTPVVATACPTGVKEILQYGEAGILTPPGNAAMLAKAIADLLADKTLQKELQDNGRIMTQQFNIANTMKLLESAILD